MMQMQYKNLQKKQQKHYLKTRRLKFLNIKIQVKVSVNI